MSFANCMIFFFLRGFNYTQKILFCAVGLRKHLHTFRETMSLRLNLINSQKKKKNFNFISFAENPFFWEVSLYYLFLSILYFLIPVIGIFSVCFCFPSFLEVCRLFCLHVFNPHSVNFSFL